MDPSERSVYLTFDDGPIPESTPFLLETLRRYGVKATFFVVGENVQKHPDLFRQIIEDGHQVGNHTYHHLGSFKHWAATYLIDTFKCQQAIERPTPQPLTEGKRPTPQPIPWREGSEMPLLAATPQAERVSTPLPPREGLGGGSLPCPSLFSFRIDDERLQALMGIVTEATAMIPGTKLKASGPLLITHWGMSGPAILRLSSYAARLLYDNQYHLPLSVNWTNAKPDEVLQELYAIAATHPQKQIANIRPYGLTGRLWEYIIRKALGDRSEGKWLSLNKKEMNRLSNMLTNDEYQIAGRAPFKDEFVTCGGVSLQSINPSTLESKTHPRLYFAGEVLDIDGVTGGFNFQAAWTTAYVVAKSIAEKGF